MKNGVNVAEKSTIKDTAYGYAPRPARPRGRDRSSLDTRDCQCAVDGLRVDCESGEGHGPCPCAPWRGRLPSRTVGAALPCQCCLAPRVRRGACCCSLLPADRTLKSHLRRPDPGPRHAPRGYPTLRYDRNSERETSERAEKDDPPTKLHTYSVELTNACSGEKD